MVYVYLILGQSFTYVTYPKRPKRNVITNSLKSLCILLNVKAIVIPPNIQLTAKTNIKIPFTTLFGGSTFDAVGDTGLVLIFVSNIFN
jgi:hypothetical protein